MKKFRKLILVFSVIILLIPSFETNAATKEVKLKVSTTYKIQKGEKLKLYVKGYKKSKRVKWKSSKKKVATVSKKGVVTGKKGGTCKITATIGKKKYMVKIRVIVGERTVYEKDVAPEEQEDRYDTADIVITSINAEKKTLFEGQTFSLKITGTKKKIKWKSTNENVATVSSSGIVTAKAPGKAKIIGSFEDGSYIYENSCTITVAPIWMTSKDITTNYGATFIYFENSIHITGEPSSDSLTGIVKSVLITDVPENMEIGKIYGTDATYKYDGTNLLFNVSDLYNLGIF